MHNTKHYSDIGKIGYLKSIESRKNIHEKLIKDYLKNPTKCLWCRVVLPYKNRKRKTCSQRCNGLHQNKIRGNFSNSEIKCLFCKKEFRTERKNNKFCSLKCYKDYVGEERNKKRNLYITRWKNNKEKGWIGKVCIINPIIKSYLIEKYRNKCCKCGWDKINPTTKKVPLQVDHVDGNAKNCKEENLELICPNCHSLTPNFGRLNKNGVRIRKD